MTETAGNAPAPRRQQPHIPLVTAAGFALVIATATGIGGYMVGQGQGGTAAPSATSSPCDAATAALRQQVATVQASPDDTNMKRTLANLVVQNPSCFDPQLAASAQTLLDKIAAGETADALCAASDRPFWDC